MVSSFTYFKNSVILWACSVSSKCTPIMFLLTLTHCLRCIPENLFVSLFQFKFSWPWALLTLRLEANFKMTELQNECRLNCWIVIEGKLPKRSPIIVDMKKIGFNQWKISFHWAKPLILGSSCYCNIASPLLTNIIPKLLLHK